MKLEYFANRCLAIPVIAGVMFAFFLFGNVAGLLAADVPTDNPVATFYSGDEGYPPAAMRCSSCKELAPITTGVRS